MQGLFTAGVVSAALFATAATAQPLQISYPGDATMDCAAIAAESGRMDQLIAESNAQVAKADGTAQGAGLASTVAVEGMLRTGMLGRVPGAGMFANNAANMAKQRAETVRKAAADQIQTANTRKALLAGLYAGKSCNAAPPAAEATVPAPAGS